MEYNGEKSMKYKLVSLCNVAMLAAICTVPAHGQQAGDERAARAKEAAGKPTPRMADGHPNLTGFWADRPFERKVISDGKRVVYQEPPIQQRDVETIADFKNRVDNEALRPKYKPEFVAKQQEFMLKGSLLDPGVRCYPWGVPRIGPPTEIVQTSTTIYLLYGSETGADPVHTFRAIPIGGKHDPNRDPKPDGDSIARWEGDALVVDVVNIDAETWLDGDGSFHDENLHVVERFTRKGNTIDYEVTVEDPTLFMEPWRPINPRVTLSKHGRKTLILRPAGEHQEPDYACVEHDLPHKTNTDRH